MAAIYMDCGREPGSHAACPKGRARGTFSTRHECACDAAQCSGGAELERQGWAVCAKHAARLDAGAQAISWAAMLERTRISDPALADARDAYHAPAVHR